MGSTGEVGDSGGRAEWAQVWLRGPARGQQAGRPRGHCWILRLFIMKPPSLSHPLGAEQRLTSRCPSFYPCLSPHAETYPEQKLRGAEDSDSLAWGWPSCRQARTMAPIPPLTAQWMRMPSQVVRTTVCACVCTHVSPRLPTTLVMQDLPLQLRVEGDAHRN